QGAWREAKSVVSLRGHCHLVNLGIRAFLDGDTRRWFRLRFRIGYRGARHLLPNTLLRWSRLGQHLGKSALTVRGDCLLFHNRRRFLEVKFFLFCLRLTRLYQLFLAGSVRTRHFPGFACACTSLFPVRKSISPCQEKGKADRHPLFCCIE